MNRLLGIVLDVEYLFTCVHREEDADTKQVYFYLFKVRRPPLGRLASPSLSRCSRSREAGPGSAEASFSRGTLPWAPCLEHIPLPERLLPVGRVEYLYAYGFLPSHLCSSLHPSICPSKHVSNRPSVHLRRT